MNEFPEFSSLSEVKVNEKPQSITIDVGSIKSGSYLVENSPQVPDMKPKSSGKIVYALLICSCLLVPVSVLDDVWLTQTIDRDVWGDTVFTQEVHVGLHQFMYETCVDGTDCEYDEQESFSDAYELCMEEADEDEIDEYCGPWSDLYYGGMTATVLFVIATILLFAAIVLQGKPESMKRSNKISIVAGILIIVSIFVWHLMLPDAADNLDWARAPWLAVLSAALAIAAGFIGNKQLNESP